MRGLLALAALFALSSFAPVPTNPGWDEIAWPLPRDAWSPGRAYRCRDCQITVTIRPKLGFCNCGTGVTDDAEVDAVSDIDALSDDFAAPAPGEPVVAAGLRGRARTYAVRLRSGTTDSATGFALSSKCDLVVAAALGSDAADHERIRTLLDTPEVAGWIAATLGGSSVLRQ